MTVTFLAGDCRDRLAELPANSVHCVITSPPYFGLRNYGVDGQLGLEPTPDAYVAALVDVFRAVRRVLRDDGVVWLNLGDSYAMTTRGAGGKGKQHTNAGSVLPNRSATLPEGLAQKQLLGIPWRVAFALQADGWYLRSDVIWAKPNPMPESVTDRPTRAHEYLFLLTKAARYFYDADAVREPLGEWSQKALQSNWQRRVKNTPNGQSPQGFVPERKWGNGYGDAINPAGRNLRSVWTIATQPFPGSHFAVMPARLVEPCVKAGTSERGVCPHCGSQWRRVVERERGQTDRKPKALALRDSGAWHGDNGSSTLSISGGSKGWASIGSRAATTGWQPACTCPPHAPIPATVLDPFSGAGTVAMVADRLGRDAIGIELNPQYIEMAQARLERDREKRPKPAPTLFDFAAD